MSLAHLPAELLHATLTHLAPEDLAAVAAASRALKAAAYDERLWAAAVKGKARSQQCGAAILTPSSRLWYAMTHTRCVHCQYLSGLPVRTTNYRRLEEVRGWAHDAMRLSRDQSAQIQAALRRSKSRISVAVWPTPHGARVWMADDSRLDPDELRLLCSREAVEGWTRLTNGLTGGGEAVVRWDWENWASGTGWEVCVEQDFLVEAVKGSDLARYLPPFRAPTVEARLQIEMRAKEIGLQRILLDGDCVFGFCLGYMDCVQYGSRADAPPPPMNFTDVLMCQRSSDRHDTFCVVADNDGATGFDQTAFGPPDPAAHAAWNAVVNHAVNHGV